MYCISASQLPTFIQKTLKPLNLKEKQGWGVYFKKFVDKILLQVIKKEAGTLPKTCLTHNWGGLGVFGVFMVSSNTPVSRPCYSKVGGY